LRTTIQQKKFDFLVLSGTNAITQASKSATRNRQSLLEEEHKNKCGPNCEHFRNAEKGIPVLARYQAMSPAEFLLKSRGM